MEYCYKNCGYQSITEEQQNKMKIKPPHYCENYDKRLYHKGHHPNLIRLEDCKY